MEEVSVGLQDRESNTGHSQLILQHQRSPLTRPCRPRPASPAARWFPLGPFLPAGPASASGHPPPPPERGALLPGVEDPGTGREGPPPLTGTLACDPAGLWVAEPRAGRGGAPVGAAHLAPGAPAPRRASPSPRRRRPRPPARPGRFQPLQSAGPRRCPPPARVGGRWVSAEKVNEGGGGGSERLTRPGPSAARVPRPPTPWTRPAPWWPSPPPGKQSGGARPGASRGSDSRTARSRGGVGGRAKGARDGAPSPLRAAGPRPAGKGVVYFVHPGRCPGNSVRLRPEYFRVGAFMSARPFWGYPRAEPPGAPTLVQTPRVFALARGGVGDPASGSSPAADWPRVRPRASRVGRPSVRSARAGLGGLRDLAGTWVPRSRSGP